MPLVTPGAGGQRADARLARDLRPALGGERGRLLVAHVDEVDALVAAAVVDREEVPAREREQLGDAVRLQGARPRAGRREDPLAARSASRWTRAGRGYPIAISPGRMEPSPSTGNFDGHVSLCRPDTCSPTRSGCTTWTRVRGTPRPCCWSTATPPGATSGGTSSDRACWRARPPLRGVRPHGLRPLRQAPAACPLRARRHIDNAVALIDELDLRDVVLVVHDWGGPIGLGATLERRDRLRAVVAMNTWAWELPSFLPGFVREFRTEGLGEILALGGNMFGGVDPRRNGQARHRPGDDGRLPGAVPGLLVARRHARVLSGTSR